MAGRLQGKGALIIGAASRDNMAQVIAKRFVAEGAKVMVAGRKREELERFADETGCQVGICDITNRAEVFALAQHAKAQLGHVDIGLNATGWGLLEPFEFRIMNGNEPALTLKGMHRIDEQRFQALKPANLKALVSKGFMSRIYAHFASLENFGRL